MELPVKACLPWSTEILATMPYRPICLNEPGTSVVTVMFMYECAPVHGIYMYMYVVVDMIPITK